MFKKNLYSFCALIALSCNAYAMGDDLSPTVEEKGGRSALRASTASLSIDDQEPAEASQSSPASSTPSAFFPNNDEKVTFTWAALEQAGSFQNPNPDPRAKALRGFLHELFFSKMNPDVRYELPILQRQLDGNIWDLMNDREQIQKAIEEANASSPAASVQNSLFSNDDEKVTFTWSAFVDAVERGESRAKNLHDFLMEKYRHDGIKWDEKPFYKMPFSQKQLDEDLWAISEPFEIKLDIAVGTIPTTREAITKLAAAISSPINDTQSHKGREIELRLQALKAVDKINALNQKITSTEAEYESFREIRIQELAAKEEAERHLTAELESSRAQTLVKAKEAEELAAKLAAQGEELESSRAQTAVKAQEAEELTSQLAALRAEFEALKVESLEATKAFASVLAKKRAQDQLLQSTIDDVKETLAAAGERLASLSTQASE
ncbi:MAG: hypothetical protein K2Y08_06375 [Alphaproteobacteria bacterium]|nr:hypothetical protein [Alphaproteobacteria bacterium]